MKSEKNYAVAVGLSAVFGIIGIQHFYLGRWLLGITDVALSLFTLVFFIQGQWLMAFLFFAADFLHTLITTILLLTGSFADGKGCIGLTPAKT